MSIETAYLLRASIAKAESQLKRDKAELSRIEHSCKHNWSIPQKAFIKVTKYRQGDIVRNGVDFYYKEVPYEASEPQWSRTCSACGQIEVTSETVDKIVKEPKF